MGLTPATFQMKPITTMLWQVPAYLPYLQPSLTEAAIEEAERTIGFKLPVEYLNILRVQNGGYIRLSLPDMVHNLIAGIGPYFPSLTAFDWHESADQVSFPLTGLVPFDGDGHWHLCLDYRERSEQPCITYVDIECDEQKRIADSFGQYLQMLRLDTANIFVWESDNDIQTVKQRFASVLNAPFDEPDTWACGFPMERVSLGQPEDAEWLWLSPNRVPQAFVRPQDDRFEELRLLPQKQALRYPEVPENSFLVISTDQIRATVLSACSNHNVKLQPLANYANPEDRFRSPSKKDA
jgi:hypothetical protein